MIIACIGDGLTAGDYGIKGQKGIANVQEKGYPYFLAQYMGCEVRNFGKCGFKSSDYLKYYEEGNVCVKDADLILVMLGTNGGHTEEGTSHEDECYRKLVGHLIDDAPRARVLLMTPPDATENPEYSCCGYMPAIRAAQKFTRKTAGEMGLQLVDIDKRNLHGAKWEYLQQSNDGLHMNYIGYARMAGFIYDNISKFRKPPFATKKLSGIPEGFRFVAHRGLSGIECENTQVAFTAAGNHSFYGIETDIWRTSDGKFICCHDESTGRICNVDKVIEKTDFDTLRSLTLNDVDRKTPSNALRLATPEEYVRTCKKYGKHCVAEFKSKFTLDEVRAILDIFEKEDYLENTTFIGVDMDNLDKVRMFYPDQSCQFLTGQWNLTRDWTEKMGAYLSEHKVDIDTDWFVIDEPSVRRFHEMGIKVNVWTVDCPEIAKYVIDCGADFITTNIIERG